MCEARTAVPAALDEREPVDLAFHLALAPRGEDRCEHRLVIAPEPPRRAPLRTRALGPERLRFRIGRPQEPREIHHHLRRGCRACATTTVSACWIEKFAAKFTFGDQKCVSGAPRYRTMWT